MGVAFVEDEICCLTLLQLLAVSQTFVINQIAYFILSGSQ